MYQARTCGVEAELTAAKGEGVGDGVDVFYRSNIDLMRFRNAHVNWMTLINSCRETAIEIVQRNEPPDDAR